MLQSYIIDIEGAFVGVAVRLANGFRFIAIDPRVEDLGETIWSDLGVIRRLARAALVGAHPPSITTAPPPGEIGSEPIRNIHHKPRYTAS